MRTVRTETSLPSLRRKKLAGARGYERGSGPESGARRRRSARGDGEDLILEADVAPPADVLDALARQKSGVLTLLRIGRDGWSGVAEFDGGLPREQAEARAFACCVVEWVNRNPVRSVPYRPLRRRRAHAHDPLLPFGTESAATPGCIRAAGQLGMPPDGPRRPPPFHPWVSPREEIARSATVVGSRLFGALAAHRPPRPCTQVARINNRRTAMS